MSEIESLVEVQLLKDVKVIQETLSRMGIANRREKVLYPSCYLYQNFEKFFITHFKELFLIEKQNGFNDMNSEDQERRNAIIHYLWSWRLIDVDLKSITPHESFVYILPFKEKPGWKIKHKFNPFKLNELCKQ